MVLGRKGNATSLALEEEVDFGALKRWASGEPGLSRTFEYCWIGYRCLSLTSLTGGERAAEGESRAVYVKKSRREGVVQRSAMRPIQQPNVPGSHHQAPFVAAGLAVRVNGTNLTVDDGWLAA